VNMVDRAVISGDFALLLPYTTVVLAMSADGKIADVNRAPARFGSEIDRSHLEIQIAQSDAVLFGAGTLRAYGTTLKVAHSDLLAQRHHAGKPAQPVQIVCSRSANLDPTYRFFSQPVPRWLLTTEMGAGLWRDRDEFEKIVIAGSKAIDWLSAFEQLFDLGCARLAVLGGGELVGSLFAANLIDELWLTICPLILGGAQAPTPVEGGGFSATIAPRLDLVEAKTIAQEVFLHYRVNRHPGFCILPPL
jgi:5-amino-6-(5-phosphoribosylamino)uracil reductase